MDISELCISDPLGYHNQWVCGAGTGRAGGGLGPALRPAAGGMGQRPRSPAASVPQSRRRPPPRGTACAGCLGAAGPGRAGRTSAPAGAADSVEQHLRG